MMSDIASQAILNANRQWCKDNNTGIMTDPIIYNFKDWCKREHGFEYQYLPGGWLVSTNVLDKKKYAWFLLKWS
jgi:hypothetical protein